MIPLVAVFGLSLLYCIGLDLELLGDSRIQTERWFVENVDKSTPVACHIRNISWAPRLHSKGYPYLCPWKAPSLESVKSGRGDLPEYLIISTPWMTGYEPERIALRQALVSGETVYTEVITFRGANSLWPDRTIFGFAGWPLKPAGSISPVMKVFKK